MSRSPSSAEGIRRIVLPTPFQVGTVNAYLLPAEPVTLVDAGPRSSRTLAALDRGLHEAGVGPDGVQRVILTHQHHDHSGLAAELRERGAEVCAIAPLASFLADFDSSMDADDAFAVTLMRRHGVDEDAVSALRELSRAFRRYAGTVEVDRVLGDVERITAGGRRLEVMHRPGHSPTDTLLHDTEDRVLLAGDHLLERISSNPVAHALPGTADPVDAAASPDRPKPLVDYLASLRRTLELDVAVVLPGHGEPFTGHRELIERRMEMHRRRARRILDRIDGPTPAAELAHALWRRLPVAQTYLALSEILGHLDVLEAEGRVRAVETGGTISYERIR